MGQPKGASWDNRKGKTGWEELMVNGKMMVERAMSRGRQEQTESVTLSVRRQHL